MRTKTVRPGRRETLLFDPRRCPRCDAQGGGTADSRGRYWFSCGSNYSVEGELFRGADCADRAPPLAPGKLER
jgi:hypothetical protein